MKRQALTGAFLAALLLLSCLPALAQSPAGMKLYVFTSGSLGGFPKGALQIGGQGNIDWAPVSFYVITHPKGNVMFDTGNNDKTITDPDGWWGPLAKGFGLKMTQNDEMKAAWWPDPGYSVYYIPGDFADTKKVNMIRLNGDLDLFGDKSVEFRRAPGHTPGSQFAIVRLPKTGTVLLTSDVVYLKESLDKNLIPPIPGTWSPGAMYDSYQKLRVVRDGEGASIFYGHDPDVFKATKQAPAFYE